MANVGRAQQQRLTLYKSFKWCLERIRESVIYVHGKARTGHLFIEEWRDYEDVRAELDTAIAQLYTNHIDRGQAFAFSRRCAETRDRVLIRIGNYLAIRDQQQIGNMIRLFANYENNGAFDLDDFITSYGNMFMKSANIKVSNKHTSNTAYNNHI